MLDFTPTLHDATWHDYPIYRAPWSASKLIICDSNAAHTPLFFANPFLHHRCGGSKTQTDNTKPNRKPDITLHAVHPTGLNAQLNTHGRHLHAAEGKAGPVVATAHFRHTRRTTGLAFGDPSHPDALHWETMTGQGRSKGRYSFALPPADIVNESKHFFDGTSISTSSSSSSTTKRNTSTSSPGHAPHGHSHSHSHDKAQHHQSPSPSRALTWKRTHSTTSGLQCSTLGRMSMRHWKLVDDATGRVVALFEKSGVCSGRKWGTLRVRVDIDGDAGMYAEKARMPCLWWEGGDDEEMEGGDREQGEVAVEKGKHHQHQPLFLAGVVLSYCVITERARREG